VLKICVKGHVYVRNLTKTKGHIKAREGDSVLDPKMSWQLENKGRTFLVQRRGAGDLNEHFNQEGVQKAAWW